MKEDVLNRGFEEGAMCDLMLAMGSSLRVTPAANVVENAGYKKNAKMVIINLQKTPYDKLADLCIYGMIDDVIKIVMKKLALEIPKFKLSRWAEIKLEESKQGSNIKVQGIDKAGGPFDLFTEDSTKTLDASKFEAFLSFQGHY